MKVIIIKITCPNMEEAKRICTHLLERKLISSGNYFPIKSISCRPWKIKEVDEVISFLKTRKENWEKVKDEILKIHPYKVPCIMKIDAEANEIYESRILSETK
jgi:periplasmic divalent cation tolerance protein